jgi:hypothetical protein
MKMERENRKNGNQEKGKEEEQKEITTLRINLEGTRKRPL